jgi:hypothetical protein
MTDTITPPVVHDPLHQWRQFRVQGRRQRMAQRRPVCGLSLPAGACGRGEDIDHHRGRQAGTVWVFCPDKERRGGAVVVIGTPPARLDVDRERRLRGLQPEDINEPPIIGGDGVRDVPRHIPASDTRETIALLLGMAQRCGLWRRNCQSPQAVYCWASIPPIVSRCRTSVWWR